MPLDMLSSPKGVPTVEDNRCSSPTDPTENTFPHLTFCPATSLSFSTIDFFGSSQMDGTTTRYKRGLVTLVKHVLHVSFYSLFAL